MRTIENIMNYHCPRWEELPQIDLYMDQLLSVLESHIKIFSDDDSKIITSTMINNYVKQKIIKPPVNKKYNRNHIAFLYIVCILKKLMGLNEIYNTKQKLLEQFSIDKAYNMFCDIFEESLKSTFDLSYEWKIDKREIIEVTIIESVTKSFANILYARYLISTITDATPLVKTLPKNNKKNTN